MKHFFILICALGLALAAGAAPGDREMRRAVAEVRAAIDAIESAALESQSLEELNAAAREEVIRELDLSAKQVKAFDPFTRPTARRSTAP